MARSAFDDAVWIPGQPLDPSQDSMQPKEVTDRLLFLEKALSALQIGDLPMGQLKTTMEQEWLPDAATLFAPGAIGNGSLAFSVFYGQLSAAGAFVTVSDSKLSAVRNSAGNYTVNYPAFKTVPAVQALPQVAVTGLRYTAKTVSSVNIIMSADSDFDFLVIGK